MTGTQITSKGPKPRPLAERFWEKVDKTEACWTWNACTDRSGYGRFGTPDGARFAHRIAFELAVGRVPAGLSVLHRCDNPPCVRPDHLFAGTAKDNAQDMVSKRRSRGQRVTHCTQGHDLANGGAYTYGTWRRCKTCIAIRGKVRYARRKAVAA